jgi:uncharacterized protein involved in exopolysaccharide biosynthesis
MKNNNPNNYIQEDEIDLKKIFKLLINSKKLIIAITLAFTIFGAIYTYQTTTSHYYSTALIEIGVYEDEQILIEPTHTLIQELTIHFIHKQKFVGLKAVNLSLKPIENRLLEMRYTSPSPEKNKEVLNSLITFIENRHLNMQNNSFERITNQLTYKIESLMKLLVSNDLSSDMMLKLLLQEKGSLELELEILMKQKYTNSQLIGEIVNNTIESKKELTILFSFIIGLSLSIIMVLILNFLKAFKEE